MQILFIIILYISFISLGFGSSLIGVAWPAVQAEMQLPVSYGGYISTARTIAVIIACYLIGKLVSRFGTAKVGLLACAIITGSWIGFAASPDYIWLLLSAIPLGLGAGALDSAFNDFMAQHYSANVLSWLHSFWGLGAVVGPLIMSGTVQQPGGWRTAFCIVAAIELLITLMLLVSLPLWKRVSPAMPVQRAAANSALSERLAENARLHPIRMRGMGFSMACFFLYNGIETCIAMWTASWLIAVSALSDQAAAGLVSLYFLGIMAARMLGGLTAGWIGNRIMLRAASTLMLLGAALLFIPGLATAALIVLGIGSGPMMPTMIHESPRRFGTAGKTNPVGFQMAVAFVGGSALPPLVGQLCQSAGFSIFPVLILAGILLQMLCNEGINRTMSRIAVSNE